jgi:TonB family protein
MMDSTEKRCLVGSALLHGAVIGLFTLATLGFMSRKDPVPPDSVVLEVISLKDVTLTDGPTAGGSAPAAAIEQTPAPQREIVQPAPDPAPVRSEPVVTPEPTPEPPPARKPETRRKPEPVEETIKPPVTKPIRNDVPNQLPKKQTRKKPDPVEETIKPPVTKPIRNDVPNQLPKKQTRKKTDPPKRVVDLTQKVTLDPKDTEAQRDRERRETAGREARKQAETQRRDLVNNIRSASNRVADGTASGVSVQFTGGGGGQAAINYGDYIREEFMRVWVVPSSATPSMLAKATITLSSDGTVSDAQIISRSGNSAFDRSVGTALKKVRNVRGFPAGSSDQHRTYTIHFQPTSSQGTG